MKFDMMTGKSKLLLSFFLTLLFLYLFENSLLILACFLLVWIIAFSPVKKEDYFVFAIASLFFLFQNYSVLVRGGFEFTHKDIFLMPWYEPFLWGYYFLFLKRLFPKCSSGGFIGKGVVGLVVTSFVFSLFSENSLYLTFATIGSTIFLFILFHSRCDGIYAFSALVLGTVVELFGVHTGLWRYPEPDIFKLPWWFITMWLSVGLLGRNFLFPLAERAENFLAGR